MYLQLICMCTTTIDIQFGEEEYFKIVGKIKYYDSKLLRV